MNKKFLFVHLNINAGCSNVNHGIAFLTPVVKKHSYDVTCLIIDDEISCQDFRNKIDEFNPSIVGFSCTSHQFKYLMKYSKIIGNCTKILQIAGGAGPTLDPEWILSQTNVKGICIGEGEIPLDVLLDNVKNERDIFDTDGFYWNMDGEVKKNSISQFVSDLSKISFPDYTIYEKKVIIPKATLLLMLSRGCPYHCSFCCNAALRGVYHSASGYFRLPSVEYCISLIEEMVKQHPETKFIEFEDDLLMANRRWFEDFAKEYKKRINIPYRVCARVECVTSDIVKTLKCSGCKRVLLGLESGNEYLRNNLLKKEFSNKALIDKCKMIKKAGLKLSTFNIIGFPFEGRREMKDTLSLNKKIAPDDGFCSFFYPYKGTELYEICKKNGLLKNEAEMLEITNYGTRPSIKMTSSQERECIYFREKISNYLRKRYFQSELAKISADLSPGLKKYFIIFYYWVYFTLLRMASLYRIIKKIFRLSGIAIQK